MSALRQLLRTDGRGAATTFVWLLEALVAWSLATALGSALAGPLLTHPAGVHALYAEDGRLLLDFLRVQSASLDLAGSVALAGVALWALAGVLLGGFVPAVASAQLAVPTVSEALSDSLRRAPTLLTLALLSALGYGLAGLLGWFAWRYVDRAAALGGVHDDNARGERHLRRWSQHLRERRLDQQRAAADGVRVKRDVDEEGGAEVCRFGREWRTRISISAAREGDNG